ncbi:MAG: hypothetical protein AABY15_03430 [Nanoarchaeota archaeon]
MNRNELVEMIRQEIRSLAYETLRSSSQKDKKNKIFKPKGLSEEELEITLFHGGSKPEEKDITKILPVSIKENYGSGIPKIQSSEVTAFEDSFEEMLSDIEGASVVFDKQSNGYSLKMWIGQDGIEAGASGVIEMGNNGKIEWSYSLKNGLSINAKDLNVDKGNRYVVDKLYNNYNSWQKEWREKLTIQPGKKEVDEMPAEVAPTAEAPVTEPSGGAPAL